MDFPHFVFGTHLLWPVGTVIPVGQPALRTMFEPTGPGHRIGMTAQHAREAQDPMETVRTRLTTPISNLLPEPPAPSAEEGRSGEWMVDLATRRVVRRKAVHCADGETRPEA